MKNITTMKKLFLMLLPILGLSSQSFGQGDLLVSPVRIVFEGNKQKQELNLVNIGKDSATYTISFIQYKMKEDGSIVIIENPDPGQMFADPFLRVFPRKVSLAPGEPQVIMLQCSRNADMPAGEYRSHLYFRAENYNTSPLTKNPKIDTAQLSVQLIPIYGISIPVIIRSGAVNVSSTVSNLKLQPLNKTERNLLFTINRTGNTSVYGDIYVDFVPAKGKSYQVGVVKGVGVYTDISKRNMVVSLTDTKGKQLTNGKLKVQYVSNDEKKQVTYAKAELVLK
jgi:hypothetical protein